MKNRGNGKFWMLSILLAGLVYANGCTHDNELLESNGPDIVRGNEKLTLGGATVFDKTHSNVGWETLYLGSTALLTGRFDNFNFTSFSFDESNPAGISFEGWVWLNTVNTSEPGRDKGCLMGTYGTDVNATTEAYNVAILKSKSVELSKTDKGYDVKADFTFHGVTREVICKMYYDGKTQTTSGTTVRDVLGFSLSYQFLAKTDYLIVSNNIADKVTVKVNTVFRRTL